VAAIWERLRAQDFQQKYMAIRPIAASSCKDLDRLEWRVKTFDRQVTSATPPIAPDYEQVLNDLNSCAKESREQNKARPGTEGARAQFLMTSWDSTNKAIELRRLSRDYDEVLADDTALTEKYNSLVRNYNDLLEAAQKSARASGSYIASLQRFMLLQSVQRQPVNCDGTSYSYGTWGTFNLNCH
jgi:hypothetical protein